MESVHSSHVESRSRAGHERQQTEHVVPVTRAWRQL